MARIRTVKPQFFEHVEIGRLPYPARLLAIGLLQLADGHGRLQWTPKRIEAHVFPYDDDVDLDGWAAGLEQAGWLVRYEVAGRRFAAIPNFRKHQRITGKEAGYASEFPEPSQALSQGNNGEAPERFPGKYLDAQEQGKGTRKGNGSGTRAPAMAPLGSPVVAPDDDDEAVRLIFRALLRDRDYPSNLQQQRCLLIVQESTPEQRAAALQACAVKGWGWGGFSRAFDEDGRYIDAAPAASTNPPVAGEPIRRTPAEEKLWQAYLVGEAARARGDEII